MNKVSAMNFNAQRAAAFSLVVLCMAAVFMIVAERLDMLDARMNEVIVETNQASKMDAEQEMLANNIRLHAEQSEGKLALLFFVEKRRAGSLFMGRWINITRPWTRTLRTSPHC